jgi:hypothetical protein
MKTTLIVIQGEEDLADAKKLIEKLMGSSDLNDRARMVGKRVAPALDEHGPAC